MAKKRRKKPPVRRQQENATDNKQQAKVVKTSEAKVTKTVRTSKSEKSTTRKPAPRRRASSNRKKSKAEYTAQDLVFGRENYMLVIGGLALIFIGFMLMNGGSMPDAETWDDSIIYSPMRITVAPILILAGLIVEIWAIFRKPKAVEVAGDTTVEYSND